MTYCSSTLEKENEATSVESQKQEETMTNENGKKGFITFKQMLENYESSPKEEFLFSGIKEKSFGLVFGPSKKR